MLQNYITTDGQFYIIRMTCKLNDWHNDISIIIIEMTQQYFNDSYHLFVES